MSACGSHVDTLRRYSRRLLIPLLAPGPWPMKTLFPHQKLDWTITHLEERLQQSPGDPGLRTELARALLASGLFHRGGERACSLALNTARKVLNDDPASVEALVIAGMSLVSRASSRRS